MQTEDAEEYTQSLGQIVAGSWRQIALAKRLGVPKALGLTTEQWVNGRLGGYVRMSVAERREAVKELTGEGLSQREIHDVTGMGLGSVNRALHSVPNGTTVGEDVQENEGATVPDGTPLDALAVLAADDAVQKQIKVEAEKAEKEAAREAARAAIEIDDGCTVDDLKDLIAAGKKFSVIYADPPWAFKVYSGKGKQRSAERHYDTASLDDIKALPIANLAGLDCALFLWCVMPELPGALDVIRA